MIILKSKEEIQLMREAGKISAIALSAAGMAIEPGITTKELAEIARKCIKSHGASPSFLENNFPDVACISVNEEVIHFVPSDKRIIKEGDIVSIDVGANIYGFHGDNACTFPCGNISNKARKLIDVTKKALQKGIEAVTINSRIGNIGYSIQNFVESAGLYVVKKYVGHGIGRSLHEAPSVPNFANKTDGELIENGLVIAIEPMVNLGTSDVEQSSDGWGVFTKDRSLSAHFEHTVAVIDGGIEILTELL
ncbi:MAG: type I methionyl aminopeptidase [Firmicutes bacterium]|nr:type I methionyl aminopeptidase [Bacillota bacterium]